MKPSLHWLFMPRVKIVSMKIPLTGVYRTKYIYFLGDFQTEFCAIELFVVVMC